MRESRITIEPLSNEVRDTYVTAGLERGKHGYQAINWTFESNPLPFAVARVDGRIVGISGYIRSKIQFGNSTGIAFQAVDSFVSPEMRGRGLFTQLACAYDNYASEVGADLVWGFPNDNAAPAWFGKLGWHKHGQVPFLIKPLRVGFFLRKIGITCDFPITNAIDQNILPVTKLGDWTDVLWEKTSTSIGISIVRDQSFLQHRLLASPQAKNYRIVADTDESSPSIVVTLEAHKHGGHIAYIMEALGESALLPLLMSEIGRLTARGVEIALAWSYPWSPNYRTFLKAGFVPLPEFLRPIRIWFGCTPKSPYAQQAILPELWYLSYLNSDGI